MTNSSRHLIQHPYQKMSSFKHSLTHQSKNSNNASTLQTNTLSSCDYLAHSSNRALIIKTNIFYINCDAISLEMAMFFELRDLDDSIIHPGRL